MDRGKADKDTIHALHLFSDKKILPWIKETFLRKGWFSEFIIINRQAKHQQKETGHQTWEVSGDKDGIDFILGKAEQADILFYHLLDNIKAEIAIRMVQPKIQCWSFYGTEVYQQTPIFKKKLYGPVTSRKMIRFPEIRFRYELRAMYYRFIRRESTPYDTLQRAIPKIDFILWYIEKEINFIQQHMQLPPFLFFQHFRLNDVLPLNESFIYRDQKKILVGNSATIENNHFDILGVLSKLEMKAYTITVPLTYGQFGRYKKSIKQEFTKCFGANVHFIEEHMPIATYYDELKKHGTAIFLHQRQQGLGNIFYLIYIGTKVYLSGKSIIYSWLRENSIDVFCFEDEFDNDFRQHQITLTEEQGLKNRHFLRTLLDTTQNENTFMLWEKSIDHQRKAIIRAES